MLYAFQPGILFLLRNIKRAVGVFKKRFKREDKTYVVMKYQNKNSAVVLLYFPCEEKKKLFFLH